MTFLSSAEGLLEAVDEMVPPVHLFGHSELRHVHLCVNVFQTILKVLRQTVDGTVGQGGIGGVQRCETHILQSRRAVQIFRPELDVLKQASVCHPLVLGQNGRIS